jgi:hypothetical protein
MATISLPDLQPTDRVRRGILLYLERGDEIEPLGKGRYLVPGCKGGPYTVDVGIFHDEPEAESCDCPDFQHRGETCKHLVPLLSTGLRLASGSAIRGQRQTDAAPAVSTTEVARRFSSPPLSRG